MHATFSAARTATLAALATCSLAAIPLDPLPRDGRSVTDWWETVGSASAGITIIRALAVGGFASLAALALTVAVVSIGAPSFGHRIVRLVGPGLGRLLGTGTLALSMAGCSPVAAEQAPIVLIGVDAHETGPLPPGTDSQHPLADATVTGRASEVESAGPAPTWTVVRGESLWSIAEHVVLRVRPDADESDVASYWGRLIDTNRDSIGDDADLIFPGLRLVLPPTD